MVEQILTSLTFTKEEIAVITLLFVFFLVQIFFLIFYYRKPYSYARKREKDPSLSSSYKSKVSVIIASENEADNLSDNLPLILAQDYPDFEVIVVNNGSTDETDVLLQSLKQNNPNLYHTYLPYSNDKAFGRRKLALTIGVKAAKGDVLLFIEPYSKPVSNQWISSLMSEMSEDKDIVLGYSFISKTDKFFNRIARFDNHIFSMQYLSMAIKGKPFTGTYRNIAFRKHLFFENKGFASYLNLENGEDVFINQIVNGSNTAICLNQDAFTEADIDNFSLWKSIKKNYSVARNSFKDKTAKIFTWEIISRILFYTLFLLLVVYSIIKSQWGLLSLSVFIFLIRLIVQLVIVNKGCDYFKSGKYYFSLILVDLLQPIYNLRFRTRVKRIKGLK